MKQYSLCFLGFGKVGRALARLLAVKATELRDTYGIDFRITGVASRSLGRHANVAGLDISNLEVKSSSRKNFGTDDIGDWLSEAKADVVFETTSLNPDSGQPAIDYLRTALEAGVHAITANKGVLVFGFQELNELARAKQKQFLFESAVLDSAPVFSLFRETLPAVKLRAFSGVFNSTSNVIIETMEAGRTFAEGLKTAQELGVTETDPSHDEIGRAHV